MEEKSGLSKLNSPGPDDLKRACLTNPKNCSSYDDDGVPVHGMCKTVNKFTIVMT